MLIIGKFRHFSASFGSWIAFPPRMFTLMAATSIFACVLGIQDLDLATTAGALTLGLFVCLIPACTAKRPRLCALVVTPAVIYGYTALLVHQQDATLAMLTGQKFALSGEVCKLMPFKEGASLRFMIRPHRVLEPAQTELRGLVLCNAWSVRAGSSRRSFLITPPSISAGDQVQVKGTVRLPAVQPFPWNFDEKGYFRRQGVVLLMTTMAPALRKLNSTNDADFISRCSALVDRGRASMLSFHRRQLGHEFGDLLSSMVIGSKVVQLSSALSDKFRDIGLSHILAASGFNLTIVITMTYWCTKFLLRSKWLVIIACFASMSAFVALAGLSASVERAAMMSSVVLLLQGMMRAPYLPSILVLALLVTCIFDPGCVFDIGLQLSYAATLGIICGVTPVSGWLSKYLSLHSKIADALSVVLVAQASVLPLQMLYFWNVGLLFLPANLLIVPMVPLITIGGFISSICCQFPPGSGLPALATMLDFLSLLPLSLLLFLVNYFASIEWAKMSVGPPFGWAVATYFASLIMLICALKAQLWQGRAAVLFAACMVALFWRQTLPELMVVHLGASVLVIDRDHQAVVVGKVDGMETRRCLTYFCASCIDAPNFSVTEDAPNTVITHRPTNTSIAIAAQQDNRRTAQRLLVVSPRIVQKPGEDQVLVFDRTCRRFNRVWRL
jgi:ComEC/Rec2-related protein